MVLLLVKCKCCNAGLMLVAPLHEVVRLLVARDCFVALKLDGACAGDLPGHALARNRQPGCSADCRAAGQCCGLCLRVSQHAARRGLPAVRL